MKRVRKPTKAERKREKNHRRLDTILPRVEAMIATNGWPTRPTPGVEEALVVLHAAYPTASPLPLARAALVVNDICAMAGPGVTAGHVVRQLVTLRASGLGEGLLPALREDLAADLELFDSPPNEAWFQREPSP